jgi:hypothetical protein
MDQVNRRYTTMQLEKITTNQRVRYQNQKYIGIVESVNKRLETAIVDFGEGPEEISVCYLCEVTA